MSYSSEATDVDPGRWVPGHLLLPLCVVLGLAVGAGVAAGLSPVAGVLGGIVAMGACFSVASLAMSSGRDADAIRARVQSQAANPALEEITVVAAALASLGGIAYVFIRNMAGDQAVATVALGITAVFATWFMLHMMYSTRYAHLYYTGEEGGVDFNQDPAAPTFSEFWYLSFTIGMSFAVSDPVVRSSRMRRVIVRHAILSYVFSAFILGCTINLIATMLAG